MLGGFLSAVRKFISARAVVPITVIAAHIKSTLTHLNNERRLREELNAGVGGRGSEW